MTSVNQTIWLKVRLSTTQHTTHNTHGEDNMDPKHNTNDSLEFLGLEDRLRGMLTARQIVKLADGWRSSRARAITDQITIDDFASERTPNLTQRDLNDAIDLLEHAKGYQGHPEQWARQKLQTFDCDFMHWRTVQIQVIDKEIRHFETLVDSIVSYWEHLLEIGVFSVRDLRSEVDVGMILERLDAALDHGSFQDYRKAEEIERYPYFVHLGALFRESDRLQHEQGFEDWLDEDREFYGPDFEHCVTMLWHAAKKAEHKIRSAVIDRAAIVQALRILSLDQWAAMDAAALAHLGEADREWLQGVLAGPEQLIRS